MKITEIWKWIDWFEDYYEVSNLWNVKSLPRIIWNWKVFYKSKEKFLKLNYHNWYSKYYLVTPQFKKNILTHRLVAQAFIDNPENKEQVNHKDWNKLNNRLDNLEWCTRSENQLHSYRVLWTIPNKSMLWKFWEKHPNSKKVNQYDLQWNFIKGWIWIKEIARVLWIKDWWIRNCCYWKNKTANGFIWKYT